MLVLIFLVLLNANDVRTQLKLGGHCSSVDHTCIYSDTMAISGYLHQRTDIFFVISLVQSRRFTSSLVAYDVCSC